MFYLCVYIKQCTMNFTINKTVHSEHSGPKEMVSIRVIDMLISLT
jgi:hypothetical protein